VKEIEIKQMTVAIEEEEDAVARDGRISVGQYLG
jgi:hypothetical protein